MKTGAAAPVAYASTYVKSEEGEEQQIPFLKTYTVFNAEQVDGLPAHFYALSDAKLEPLQRIKVAKAFFADVPTVIRSGGNLAYYNIGQDFVQLPPFEAFRGAESFYATKAHELAHSTRHEKRLNRSFARKRWGDEGYAAEELVAELASAFLCADLGLTPEVREDHASYIAQWLEVLKNDRRAIFTAASHAQKAADYLAAFSQMKEMAA